jgi:hypothetical protein
LQEAADLIGVGLTNRFDGAGRSAMRRFDDLARGWRRRTFGPRTAFYFWTILG